VSPPTAPGTGPLSRFVPEKRARGLAPHLARLPDPAAALSLLERLAERGPLPDDPVRLHALLTIGGCSPWLSGLLEQDPEAIDVLPRADRPRSRRPATISSRSWRASSSAARTSISRRSCAAS